ncbi:MAG: hypothetical protein HWE39_22565 [Oceanospirillaceae bacterium]|nr:hypothetical protein [Oceanospirillaceae bacterium]
MKLLTFILFFVLVTQYTHASLYQCSSPDGGVSFQDLPCSTDTQQKQLKNDYDSRGFLKKWFLSPKISSSSVKCTDKKCSCGNEEVMFTPRVPSFALEKSIDALINSWDTYNDILSRSTDYAGKRNTDVDALRRQACRIKIYQRMFNVHYSEVTKVNDVYEKNLANEKRKEKNRKEACLETSKQTHEEAIQAKKDGRPDKYTCNPPAHMILNKSMAGDWIHNKQINEVKIQLERLK